MENKVFRMSGMAITGHARFRDYFSPSDFLRSRELAAGFACQQSMRKLRPRNWYCSALLFQMVFNWENNRGGRIAEPLDFFQVPSVRMGMQPRDVRALREYLERCRRERSENVTKGRSEDVPSELSEDEAKKCSGDIASKLTGKTSGGEAELLGELWELAQRTGLSEEDSRRLFYLIGAGYLLAEKDLQEVPLTAEEARIAYLREEPERVSDHLKEKEDFSEEQSEDSGRWIGFPEDGLLRLPARQQPYELLLGEELRTLAKDTDVPTGNASRAKTGSAAWSAPTGDASRVKTNDDADSVPTGDASRVKTDDEAGSAPTGNASRAKTGSAAWSAPTGDASRVKTDDEAGNVPIGNSYGEESAPERKQPLRIRLCRVEALPHRQGSREIPVVLRLYRGVKDENPQVLSIFPGDYRYFNCLETDRPNNPEIHPNSSKPEQVEAARLKICPYYLHPVRVAGDGCVMERTGDVITIRDAEGKVIREISVAGRNIVSFAPERGGAGWVIAEPDKVDYSNYSMRDIYSPLVNGGIVEVRISRHVLYALRNDGTVFTQFGRGFPEASGVQSLGQLIQKKDRGNA